MILKARTSIFVFLVTVMGVSLLVSPTVLAGEFEQGEAVSWQAVYFPETPPDPQEQKKVQRRAVVNQTLDMVEGVRRRSLKRALRDPEEFEMEAIPKIYAEEPFRKKAPAVKSKTRRPQWIKDIDGRFQILTGYRNDFASWNIAGDINGANPNILEEVTWNNVKSAQLILQGDMVFNDRYVLDGMAAFADVFAGDNQDSNFDGDNRTLEFDRTNNNSDEGQLWDFSGGVGYRLHLNKYKRLAAFDPLLTLLTGYSYHKQRWSITDGFQTVDTTTNILGSFFGLDSTYEMEWQGPWLGVELAASHKKLFGSLRFEYHFADYYGLANWNLVRTLLHPKSFEHFATGRGLVFSVGAGYKITDWWSIDLNALIQDWKTSKGVDRAFFTDGVILDSQLNGANWESVSGRLGTTFYFN